MYLDSSVKENISAGAVLLGIFIISCGLVAVLSDLTSLKVDLAVAVVAVSAGIAGLVAVLLLYKHRSKTLGKDDTSDELTD